MTAPTSDRRVKIVISADVAQAIRALGETERGMQGVSQGAEQAGKKTSSMGDVMKGALAATGIESGLSGITSGLKSVVSGGLDYDKSMNTFAAVTKQAGESAAQVDERMKAVGDQAKKLGADITIPGASAQSAAAAMTELAKGGLTAQQAMDASRGTMILAAAAQIDGAQAAEIQANALNTFGLKADQAGRVANVLANVANQSSGEIGDFAQGLAQAGTVAASFGWSIEDTTNYLGLMANAGIKGSDAGTSLKTTMTALLNPTKQQAAALEELGIQTADANGNMISARDLADQLAAAKGRMTTEEFSAAAATAFGTDAVRTALVAADAGTEGYDKMADALGNVTGAQDVAAANSKGLTGIIESFKNTVDTASLSLYQALTPALSELTPALTAIVTPLAEGLAPLLSSIADTATGSLAPALETAAGLLGAIATPLSEVVGWFNGLPDPLGGAILAIGGVIAVAGPLGATFASARGSLSTLIATMRGTAGAAAAGSAGFAGFVASVRAATGAAATFGAVAKGALAMLGGPIGLAIIGVTTALTFFSSTSDDASGSADDFTEAIDKQTGALTENAAQIISAKVEASGLGDEYRAIGGNTSDLVDALGGVAGAQELVNAKMASAGTETKIVSAGMSQHTEVVGKAAKAQELYAELAGQLSEKQTEVKNTAAGATGELQKTTSATAEAGKAAEQAAEESTPFGDALKEIRSAASEADSAAQFLSITLLQMSGNTVPAEQRARANAAAFRDVGQASRDLADAHRGVGDANDSLAEKQKRLDELTAHLGETLDGQEESATNAAVSQRDLDAAARDLAAAQDGVTNAEERVNDASDKQKDALDKAAQSARDMTADAYNNSLQQLGMKGAIEQAVSTMQVQRDEFIKSAADAGIAEEAAKALADQQGLIPENVRTTYSTVGADDAKAKAKALNDELDKVNNREVRYTVVAGEVTSVGTGRTVTGGPAAVYADGGPVQGPGTGTSDSILARVSNGEWVSRERDVTRGGNLAALQFMHSGGTFPAFADGGMVGATIAGDYKSKDFLGGLRGYLQDINSQIQAAMAATSSAEGFNSSQDPSSFGWKRARGIIPFSWQGKPVLGGVAGGTQGLWTSLLNQLVPAIPGGLTEPMYGYENRDNVNSPGTPSFHSYGLAVDINAGANPNGVSAASVQGRRGAIPMGLARSLASQLGMLWGGDFSGTPDPMHFEIHVPPSGISGAGTSTVSSSIRNAAQQALSAFSLGLGTPAPVSGGRWAPDVERWRGTVVEALRLTGQSTSLADVVLNQIRTESSGNPRAINLTDSNATVRGTPSKGLIQAIDPTFQAYRLQSLPNDVYNPLANIVAGIRYAVDRYGSLAAGMRGVAYENGGGLPPGFTMAYNGTGGFETVVPRSPMDMWNDVKFALNGMQAGGAYAPTVQVFIGGKQLVDDMSVMVDGKLVQHTQRMTRAMSVAAGRG